jgi:hypothetical protein
VLRQASARAAVKHAAAMMPAGVEAARSAVYFTAASVDADDPESFLPVAAASSSFQARQARREAPGHPAQWNERITAGLSLA